MKNMDDSIPHPGSTLPAVELPGWKVLLGHACAWLIGLLFVVAGVWKITDTPAAAVRLVQALVPENLGTAAALALGIAETFSGVLIILPRFRRWGAWLNAAMLVVFMIYVGYNYTALRGADCSCFPWVKRAVGPGFFISDAIMLAMAAVAGWWAKPSLGLRSAGLILGVVTVFAVVSHGVAITRQSGAPAPESITVDGQPFSLKHGRVFLYFFDPECSHCLDAAKKMAAMNWGDTRLVAVPTVMPQFAAGFLRRTGFKAGVSNDLELLRKALPFPTTPAAVAVENGRQKALLMKFEGDEPAATLASLGFVQR